MAALVARKNLASLINDFERHASQVAIVSSRGLRHIETTYQELASLSRRFAAELVKRQIEKGERVLIWGENSSQWVAVFFGCVLRGALAVPLDVAGSVDFARRVVAEVSPRLIVADKNKLQDARFGDRVIALEDLDQAIGNEHASVVDDLVPNDPLQIVFTSGTTGDPKGIVHTHANVLASLAPIEREMGKYLKYERPFHPIRILHTLPLSHVFGQFMGLWIPPLLAAEVHYQSRLVAGELAEQIRRKRISVLAAVPRVLGLLQEFLLAAIPTLPERIAKTQNWKAWQRWWHFRDVHRLLGWKFWALVCGGASLPAEGEKFWSALGLVVVQGYGMTETTALVSLNHPFRPVQGTIGQVLPGREVKLSDQGEVLVRGETISDAVWHGGRMEKHAGEWLPTGDLADFDENGNLRFRGRKKDLIVTSSGLNIHPEDLEAVLTRQEGVRAASVVEKAAEQGPEALAVLILEPQSDAQEVLAKANGELADFQQIRRWMIWPEPDFPRTSTGKILRREIVRRLQSGEIRKATENSNGTAELNLDSLGRVQLQAQLEQQYGISLDDAALQNVRTQADVQQLVRQSPISTQPKRDANIYPRWPWNPIQQVIRGIFLELIAMPLVRFLAKPTVRQEIRKWPASPMLIVANHITSYDAAFILFALPGKVRRRVAIAMSGEMLLDYRRGRNQRHWFLNLVAPAAYFLMTALFNVFPLPQRSGFSRSFRHAGEAIDRGYNVLVFPEGRRSDDGTPQPFQSGAGLLWKELRTPALPVLLSGLGELKSRGGGWFRSGKIGIRVGGTLSLNEDRSPEQLAEDLRSAVFFK